MSSLYSDCSAMSVRTMAKYIEATAASSTATLAASNAATNYATATKYMWTALEAITKTAAGRMDAVTCAAIIGGCLVGAETAASEATKAAENARAVAAIAKEAASAATENDYLDASGWVLSDSFSAGTDNISVLDCEEFETDSVLAEWTALKAGWARYPGEGEVEDEDTEYNTSCSTRSYASLGALAHDETNEAQHPCLSCLESLQNLLCPKIDLGSQIGE